MGNWLSRIKGPRVSRGSTQAPTYGGRARGREHASERYRLTASDTAFDNSGRYSSLIDRSKTRTPR